MPLSWSDDPAELASADWSALSESDPGATFFHTPRYLKLYWEELGRGALRIATVTVGSSPVARAALELHEGRARFLGGTEVTDYMGPVGDPAHRDRSAKELLAGLATRDDWEEADLRGLAEDAPWLRSLAGAAADSGLAPRVEEDGVAPRLELPASWEEYLAAISSKRRHEIRRKARRLAEALPGPRLVDATERTLADDLEDFFRLHRSSAGPKGKFMQPGMELFFRRLADEFLADGIFRLVFLEAGGERVAGIVTFRWEGTLLLYNSAYDHRHRSLAPGMVLVGEVIRDAIERGYRRVDMLKGDLEYKYRFGSAPRPIRRLILRRGSAADRGGRDR